MSPAIGEARGEGLLRRLEPGPDPRAILRKAREEAAAGAGFRFAGEEGIMTREELREVTP